MVDNGSTNESISRIRNQFDSLTILEVGYNSGFSGGVNFGIDCLKNKNVDYILLLNNDTVVRQNFLTELVQRVSLDEKIGLIGGTIYYFHDRKKIWSAGGSIKKYTKKTFHFGENQIDVGHYDVEREVDFLSGCCLLIRREVFEKIGLFDLDYFMYYEDVDFCIRAKEAGFKIIFLPQSVIWHKTGNASVKSFIDYYRMKNYFLFLKKRFHFSTGRMIILGFPLFLERMGRIFLRKLIYHDTEKLSSRLFALAKGFKEGLIQ